MTQNTAKKWLRSKTGRVHAMTGGNYGWTITPNATYGYDLSREGTPWRTARTVLACKRMATILDGIIE